MIAIFDIGANNGLNGLAFAILNPNTKVFSFEPNPILRKNILNNKKIFEKEFGIKLKNFLFY
jgi:FkbM family methyltransferase